MSAFSEWTMVCDSSALDIDSLAERLKSGCHESLDTLAGSETAARSGAATKGWVQVQHGHREYYDLCPACWAMSEENKPNREPRKPRVKPCASCPYRSGVPARIWEESEYRKLPGYDEPMPLQPQSLFLCHQGDGDVCAGWLGHRDPADLLAVRLGIASGVLDPDCCTYATDVPLYSTGQEAAAHGMSGPPMPDPTAQSAIKKIQAKRATRQPKE